MGWNHSQHVSASTTMILSTTMGTFHSLNCFSHMTYTLQTSMYKILQNFWLILVIWKFKWKCVHSLASYIRYSRNNSYILNYHLCGANEFRQGAMIAPSVSPFPPAKDAIRYDHGLDQPCFFKVDKKAKFGISVTFWCIASFNSSRWLSFDW